MPKIMPPKKTIPAKIVMLVCVFFLSNFQVFCQSEEEIFRKKIDSISIAKPQTYIELESVFGYNRFDTLLMRKLIKKSIEENYSTGQAFAYNMLGTKYRNLSQYPKAIELHQKALDIAIDANSDEFEILSLNMLGVAYRRSDAIKTALDYSQKALVLAESIENPTKGIKKSINVSLNSIGNLYIALEQYELAIEQFQKSLRLEAQLSNKLGLAINNQNIGEAQESLGLIEDALKSYETSLEFNEDIDSDMGRVICKNSIAQIFIKQEKPKEALEILRPILKLSKELGDKYITAYIEINIGWALMKLKQPKDAEPHLMNGFNLAKKHNIPSVISLANKYLSDLEILKGNHKKALEYHKKGVALKEEITSGRNLRYVSDVIFKYESEKKNNEIESLKKKNEISDLKLRKNNTVLLISGIALALLAGILYILYHQYQLKNDKKLLTLEQTMLRSQMNPHFLFNSLNSIKLYIINNEKKNAVHYLNKFSKLVRKILEASSLKEIPLDEELETVALYMNIENIRFSNEIDFKISIDKNIDVASVKIPSLILQPFLENALWHGLSSKKGEKKIELNVRRTSKEFIEISITDNGIGRAASEKIKKNKVLKRKSIGVDITKERLTNFSKDYQNTFQMKFIDLYDDKNKAAGTKLVLEIPTV